MLGYYVECDMAACGRISEDLTRPGLVRQKDKPVINGVVTSYAYDPISQHELCNFVDTGPASGSCSTVNYLSQLLPSAAAGHSFSMRGRPR